jgi:hypothetical protein
MDAERVVTALFADPQPHIGKIYRLTGPQFRNVSKHCRSAML